jgi:(hydroxyamino)benzene mutase
MNTANGARQILIHGMAFILAGLLWGLAVPHTPFPRLAMGAHIQFENSGLLFMAMGVILLMLPHSVGRKSIGVMLFSVCLTWIMALSEVANAWWGTSEMLPIAAHQAGAIGGAPWQEFVVKLAHIGAGLGLIVAWSLLILGFVKTASTASGE